MLTIGSGLYNKVKYNVMYDSRESEGKKRRHQVDTVVEGIGINRVSQSLDMADNRLRITSHRVWISLMMLIGKFIW